MRVPAPGREEQDVLVLQVADALCPGLDHRPVAICQEWVLKGDARVELLADEEVAVVQGRCVEADEDLLWAGRRLGHFFELEAV